MIFFSRIITSLFASFVVCTSFAQSNGVKTCLSSDDTAQKVAHYWDEVRLDNADSTIERNFAEFISLFDNSDTVNIAIGFRNLIQKAAACGDSTCAFIAELAEKYLYNVDAPTHSDKYFLIYARETPYFNSSRVSSERIKFLSEVASSNLPGSRGIDFFFTDIRQKKRNLFNSLKAAPLSIMIIYDPECSHCYSTINEIQNAPEIISAVKEDVVQIILVYPEGDFDIWKSHLPDSSEKGYIYAFAEEWVDKNDKEYYYFRATPTIYILDKSGVVVCKDASVSQVIDTIRNYTRLNPKN